MVFKCSLGGSGAHPSEFVIKLWSVSSTVTWTGTLLNVTLLVGNFTRFEHLVEIFLLFKKNKIDISSNDSILLLKRITGSAWQFLNSRKMKEEPKRLIFCATPIILLLVLPSICVSVDFLWGNTIPLNQCNSFLYMFLLCFNPG